MSTPNTPTSYKDTLNLPKTDFPMKANLPVREKEILAQWEAQQTSAKAFDNSGKKPLYVLHDGPPFANGHLHLGHALNKTLKDIVMRHKRLTGHHVPYVPGWDCHGLPIEHQVVKKLKTVEKEPVKIREESAKFAAEFVAIQKEEFKRLGVWADWEHPYLTMAPAYEAEILRVFAKLVEQNRVYEGLRPVHWSTGCQTALAEAEIEYEDRTDPAIHVAFELTQSFKGFEKAQLVVWTTTPWTLPANLAVAAHPDFQYAVVTEGGQTLVLLTDRLKDWERVTGKAWNVAKTFSGKELEGLSYKHPFLDRQGKVHLAEFVTQDSGTGLVHIAPGHGHDDYQLGQKVGLKPLSPVDHRGHFTEECGVPGLVGKYVLDANKDVIEILKGRQRLLHVESYQHSYPHCWRSKTPIIFRSVKQWFIKVEAFKARALQAIDEVQWFPDWGKNRIMGSVESRQDWCISRQRTWGVPIPVFYDSEKTLLDATVVRKFADIVEKEGSNVWFASTDEALASRLGIDARWKKGTDTLDVWIDSGSSFAAVTEKRLEKFPADLYLEGSDQHRGWFQSSLLLSCATRDKAPFKSVLTHGFVVDGQGHKMSKSQGNVISPEDVVKNLGADVLRLWVVSSDYADDVRVSKDIFDRVSDTYRKFRNTFRYLLGNLHGFDPAKDTLPVKDLLEADRWALSRLAGLVERSRQNYDAFLYHRFYQDVYNFCIREMSSVYLDILKDRLYTDALTSTSGRSARTALFEILRTLLKLLSPVLVFTCEESWGHMVHFPGKKESVHLEAWPENMSAWHDEKLEAKWEKLLAAREVVLKALEMSREKKEIGNSLDAGVELSVSSEPEYEFLSVSKEQLRFVCLVSELNVVRGSSGEAVQVTVRRAEGAKCSRCWIHDRTVGKNTQTPELCSRCAEVVKGFHVKIDS